MNTGPLLIMSSLILIALGAFILTTEFSLRRQPKYPAAVFWNLFCGVGVFMVAFIPLGIGFSQLFG